VLPLIRAKHPGVRLQLAGSICTALPATGPGVERLGIVRDLDQAYAGANIVINPLRAGTGLKTKTVEALGYAKALVTTSCGAEGIEDAAGYAFLMADEPAAMAAQICGLLEDRVAASALAARGLAFARAWNESQLNVLRRLEQEPAETPPVSETLAHSHSS
jgi:glycosyltransferase involved in cell wall biosynthesis